MIWPVLMYGAEAWTLRKAEKEQSESAEMLMYSENKMDRETQQQKHFQRTVYTKATSQRIHKRRLRYVGLANRNKHTFLMTTALQGKFEGKRRKVDHLNVIH